MSNSTVVAAIDGAVLLRAVAEGMADIEDPLELPGVNVKWDFSPSWAFDEIFHHVESHLAPGLRALMRDEVPTDVEHAAAARLLTTKPALDSMTLLTNEQFNELQLAINAAVADDDFGPHADSLDDWDELAHLRPSGDFWAIIA